MIVVDVETTGQDWHKHTIISIGAVELAKPANQFYGESRIAAGVEVDDMALKINGFTPTQLKDPSKPTLLELIEQFDNWKNTIKDLTLGGQNITFDLHFLWAAYKLAPHLKPGLGYRSVDLHSLVYAHMQKRGQPIPLAKNRSAINSDIIYGYLGMPKEPNPHHGLTGAKMEAEAISRLLYGKSIYKEFTQNKIPDYLQV